MQHRVLFILIALFFTTLIMRGPITVVGPIASELQSALNMSYQTYGVLSSLPVLCFGCFTLLTSVLTKSLKIQYVFIVICTGLLIGCLLRLVALKWLFMVATVLIAAGISMLNTLMPVFIRQFNLIHPNKAIAILTALIGLSSCLGIYTAVPLLTFSQNYRFPLAIWALASFIALCLWCLSARSHISFTQSSAQLQWSILKRRATWAVVCTMGFQSLAMYTVAAWLPTFLISRGFTLHEAGTCTSIFVLLTIPASWVTAFLIRSFRNERGLSAFITMIFLVGLILWAIGGTYAYWGSVLAGFSQGVRFSLAIILISRKSGNTDEMMTLSTIAQGLGYLIGASGPLICGYLYHGDGHWDVVYGFFIVVTLIWGIAAFYGFGKGIVFCRKH